MPLIDGRAHAERLLGRTAERAAAFLAATDTPPVLATVLVGGDPASATYVRMKAARCQQVGIESRRVELPDASTTMDVVDVVTDLSNNPSVHGILVQHPVPAHIDERAVFEAIAPGKDVDGVTLSSFAALSLGKNGFHPCTPAGIMRLLDAHDVALPGTRAVVVGRSPILGLPMGMLLLRRNATVVYCHSHTVDLADEVARADIVIAAVGRPELIRGEWIEPGAIVIDAGYNAGNIGDVEFPAARQRASLITPVPGGVGPMTIAVLLEQTVTAAEAATPVPE